MWQQLWPPGVTPPPPPHPYLRHTEDTSTNWAERAAQWAHCKQTCDPKNFHYDTLNYSGLSIKPPPPPPPIFKPSPPPISKPPLPPTPPPPGITLRSNEHFVSTSKLNENQPLHPQPPPILTKSTVNPIRSLSNHVSLFAPKAESHKTNLYHQKLDLNESSLPSNSIKLSTHIPLQHYNISNSPQLPHTNSTITTSKSSQLERSKPPLPTSSSIHLTPQNQSIISKEDSQILPINLRIPSSTHPSQLASSSPTSTFTPRDTHPDPSKCHKITNLPYPTQLNFPKPSSIMTLPDTHSDTNNPSRFFKSNSNQINSLKSPNVNLTVNHDNSSKLSGKNSQLAISSNRAKPPPLPPGVDHPNNDDKLISNESKNNFYLHSNPQTGQVETQYQLSLNNRTHSTSSNQRSVNIVGNFEKLKNVSQNPVLPNVSRKNSYSVSLISSTQPAVLYQKHIIDDKRQETHPNSKNDHQTTHFKFMPKIGKFSDQFPSIDSDCFSIISKQCSIKSNHGSTLHNLNYSIEPHHSPFTTSEIYSKCQDSHELSLKYSLHPPSLFEDSIDSCNLHPNTARFPSDKYNSSSSFETCLSLRDNHHQSFQPKIDKNYHRNEYHKYETNENKSYQKLRDEYEYGDHEYDEKINYYDEPQHDENECANDYIKYEPDIEKNHHQEYHNDKDFKIFPHNASTGMNFRGEDRKNICDFEEFHQYGKYISDYEGYQNDYLTNEYGESQYTRNSVNHYRHSKQVGQAKVNIENSNSSLHQSPNIFDCYQQHAKYFNYKDIKQNQYLNNIYSHDTLESNFQEPHIYDCSSEFRESKFGTSYSQISKDDSLNVDYNSYCGAYGSDTRNMSPLEESKTESYLADDQTKSTEKSQMVMRNSKLEFSYSQIPTDGSLSADYTSYYEPHISDYGHRSPLMQSEAKTESYLANDQIKPPQKELYLYSTLRAPSNKILNNIQNKSYYKPFDAAFHQIDPHSLDDESSTNFNFSSTTKYSNLKSTETRPQHIKLPDHGKMHSFNPSIQNYHLPLKNNAQNATPKYHSLSTEYHAQYNELNYEPLLDIKQPTNIFRHVYTDNEDYNPKPSIDSYNTNCDYGTLNFRNEHQYPLITTIKPHEEIEAECSTLSSYTRSDTSSHQRIKQNTKKYLSPPQFQTHFQWNDPVDYESRIGKLEHQSDAYETRSNPQQECITYYKDTTEDYQDNSRYYYNNNDVNIYSEYFNKNVEVSSKPSREQLQTLVTNKKYLRHEDAELAAKKLLEGESDSDSDNNNNNSNFSKKQIDQEDALLTRRVYEYNTPIDSNYPNPWTQDLSSDAQTANFDYSLYQNKDYSHLYAPERGKSLFYDQTIRQCSNELESLPISDHYSSNLQYLTNSGHSQHYIESLPLHNSGNLEYQPHSLDYRHGFPPPANQQTHPQTLQPQMGYRKWSPEFEGPSNSGLIRTKLHYSSQIHTQNEMQKRGLPAWIRDELEKKYEKDLPKCYESSDCLNESNCRFDRWDSEDSENSTRKEFGPQLPNPFLHISEELGVDNKLDRLFTNDEDRDIFILERTGALVTEFLLDVTESELISLCEQSKFEAREAKNKQPIMLAGMTNYEYSSATSDEENNKKSSSNSHPSLYKQASSISSVSDNDDRNSEVKDHFAINQRNKSFSRINEKIKEVSPRKKRKHHKQFECRRRSISKSPYNRSCSKQHKIKL